MTSPMRPDRQAQRQTGRDRVEVGEAQPLAADVTGDPERGGDEAAVEGKAGGAEPGAGIVEVAVLEQVKRAPAEGAPTTTIIPIA